MLSSVDTPERSCHRMHGRCRDALGISTSTTCGHPRGSCGHRPARAGRVHWEGVGSSEAERPLGGRVLPGPAPRRNGGDDGAAGARSAVGCGRWRCTPRHVGPVVARSARLRSVDGERDSSSWNTHRAGNARASPPTPRPATSRPTRRPRRSDHERASSHLVGGEPLQQRTMARDRGRPDRQASRRRQSCWSGDVAGVAPLHQRPAAARALGDPDHA